MIVFSCRVVTGEKCKKERRGSEEDLDFLVAAALLCQYQPRKLNISLISSASLRLVKDSSISSNITRADRLRDSECGREGREKEKPEARRGEEMLLINLLSERSRQL